MDRIPVTPPAHGNHAPGDGLGGDALAGSEYLRRERGLVAGRPTIDLHAAARLQSFLQEASSSGLLLSAHDVGPGGLAVALAESCIAGELGVDVTAMTDHRHAGLFGESQSTVVVSSAPGRPLSELQVLATSHGLTAQLLGTVTGDRLRVGGIDVGIEEMQDAYESGLPRALEGVTSNA